MKDVILKNPMLILTVLKCSENEEILGPLLDDLKILEQMSVSVNWVKKREMLDHTLSTTSELKQVFVLPTLKKDALLSSLREFKQSVWSPPAVVYCIAKLKFPLYFPPMLHSMGFYGMTVSFTGLDPKEKEVQGKKIELMGGKVVPEFSTNADILIAKTYESTPEYQEACSLKKPICNVKVIDSMWKESEIHVKERIDKFSVKLFTGCVIATSGLGADERQMIEKEIGENGGKCVTKMKRKVCTHLITNKIISDEYSNALKFGIPTVTSDWLRESLSQNVRLPEILYHTDPSLRKSASEIQTQGEFVSSTHVNDVNPSKSQPIITSTPVSRQISRDDAVSDAEQLTMESESTSISSSGDQSRKTDGSLDESLNESTFLDWTMKDTPDNKTERKSRSVTFSDDVSVRYYQIQRKPKVRRQLINKMSADDIIVRCPNNGRARPPRSALFKSKKSNKSRRPRGKRTRKGWND